MPFNHADYTCSREPIRVFKIEGHTFDISQATTEGSVETRSKEKTLFFTLLASCASPGLELCRMALTGEEQHNQGFKYYKPHWKTTGYEDRT